MFARGSAEVDWCEYNYVHSDHIAEFFNTLSSIPLILLPLFGLAYNTNYLTYTNPNVKYVYYIGFYVGLASAYFHATLSLFGQLLDEIGLLWAVGVSAMVWVPRVRSSPEVFKIYANEFRFVLFIAMIISTVLTFIKPSLNAYFLMASVIPCAYGMFIELRLTKDPMATGLGLICFTLWAASVSVWIGDRSMCTFWLQIGFPYFHAVWHVLSAYASYCAIVMYSYFDAIAQAPSTDPQVRYVPKNYFFQVPYLSIVPVTSATTATANGNVVVTNGIKH